jgi:hypothetical protein
MTSASFAASEFLDLVLKTPLAVIDECVGAAAARDFEFFVRAGRRDDPCSEDLPDLDGRQSDAAARAQHQQTFTGLQLGTLFQCMIGRPVGESESRRLVEVHRLRDAIDRVRVDQGAFRHPADSRQRHDPVTRPDAGHPITDLGNNAGVGRGAD